METKDDKKPNALAEALMLRRTVVLNGRINGDSVDEVIRRLLELQMRSTDRINLLIDSGGGSVPAALQLCDMIETALTAPVHGIAIGDCASAATFIMLSCKRRLSTPHSRFLIHSGRMNEITLPINQTSSEHVEQLLNDVKRTEGIVTRFYMKHLTPKAWEVGKPSEDGQRQFVQGLIHRGDQHFDSWFTADEALEIGLIQEIKSDKLEIFPE